MHRFPDAPASFAKTGKLIIAVVKIIAVVPITLMCDGIPRCLLMQPQSCTADYVTPRYAART